MATEKEKIFSLLKGVIDPELMVNIIDLGLVYNVLYDDEQKKIIVEMTLTSPSCPLGEVIINDAEGILKIHYQNFTVNIILVWEPAWTPDCLTQQGKIALGKN